jgi:excisionase family DNA binding protein
MRGLETSGPQERAPASRFANRREAVTRRLFVFEIGDMDQQHIVWLTPEQAAARAQVGKRTIYREAAAGRLRCAKVGGRRELRIRAEWIDAWLEASAQEIE